MYEHLLRSALVIADLSTQNINAAFELGVRYGLRPHATIIVAGEGFKHAFDVSHLMIRRYKHLGEDIGRQEAARFKQEARALMPSGPMVRTTEEQISSLFMAAPPRGTSYYCTPYNFLVDLRAIGIGAAVMIGFGLSACVGGNGPIAGAAPTPGPCPCLDREFSLKVGAPATIQGEQLEIRVESVGPDSRCPVNVACVWEGDAQVTIGLSRQAQAPGRLQLHTSQQFATEGTYLNYRVRLTALMPAPRDGNRIEPGSYTATLVVSR